MNRMKEKTKGEERLEMRDRTKIEIHFYYNEQ